MTEDQDAGGGEDMSPVSDNVVPVNFGKDYNDAARALARLMGVVEEHHKRVLADPVAFIKLAHEEIAKLRRMMIEAIDALRDPRLSHSIVAGDVPPTLETFRDIRLPLSQYEALKRCEAIVRGFERVL